VLKSFFGLYITYSKYIFKFWVTQITMSAFGLFVSMAAIASQSIPFIIGSAIFAIAFFCFLLYDMMFFYGLKKSVRYDERIYFLRKNDGLKIALISYAPTVLIALLTVLFYIFQAAVPYAIAKGIIIIIHGTYNSTWYLLADIMAEPLIAILILIPGIMSCTLGYYLGLKDMPIRKLLGIPVKPPKNK